MHSDEQKQDQGFTRPKVLIVVPFRNAALELVQCFLALTPLSHKVRPLLGPVLACLM